MVKFYLNLFTLLTPTSSNMKTFKKILGTDYIWGSVGGSHAPQMASPNQKTRPKIHNPCDRAGAMTLLKQEN